MARKSAQASKTATFSVIEGLPGAVFHGDALDADSVAMARRLEGIRATYARELEDAQAMLAIDLQAMGFDAEAIRRCAVDPALITSCGYGAA